MIRDIFNFVIDFPWWGWVGLLYFFGMLSACDSLPEEAAAAKQREEAAAAKQREANRRRSREEFKRYWPVFLFLYSVLAYLLLTGTRII